MSGPLDSRLAKALRGWALRSPSPATLAAFGSRAAHHIENGDEEVVIVVVHFRAPDWCMSTARSLVASEGIRAKVVVVDNSRSAELETGLPSSVTLVRNDANLGYTGGANVVLREWLADQRGEYVVVACHDLDVTAKAVATMISVLAQDRSVGIAGPGGMHAGEPRDGTGDRISVSPRRWLTGSCLVFRRQCLADIGLFDEAFGSYAEDVDICFRAWDRGWAVVSCDDVVVRTQGSASALKDALIARNMVLLAAKRKGIAGAAVEMLLQGTAALLYGVSYVVYVRDRKRRRDSAAGARLRLSGIRDGLLEVLRSRTS